MVQTIPELITFQACFDIYIIHKVLCLHPCHFQMLIYSNRCTRELMEEYFVSNSEGFENDRVDEGRCCHNCDVNQKNSDVSTH